MPSCEILSDAQIVSALATWLIATSRVRRSTTTSELFRTRLACNRAQRELEGLLPRRNSTARSREAVLQAAVVCMVPDEWWPVKIVGFLTAHDTGRWLGESLPTGMELFTRLDGSFAVGPRDWHIAMLTGWFGVDAWSVAEPFALNGPHGPRFEAKLEVFFRQFDS